MNSRPTRPAPPIITDKDLKGFDEILGNDIQSGWAAATPEIDYNAKLVFSDDEDSPVKEDIRPNYDETRERSDSKHKDWDRREPREQEDRRGDDRHKYRSAQQQWSQQQPPPPQAQMPNNARANIDYPHHSSQSAQYSRQPIHTNYSHSRHNRSEPIVADEDELWRQRSRQHSDEMAAAVIRARQRREEEEKEHERSRKAAHEKLKALEEKSLGKDGRERSDRDSLDFDQCSHHSSESREERLSNRDSRYSNSFAANKAYPKTSTLPPRFQKQQELLRQNQQTGGQPAQTQPFDQRYNRLSESDSRDVRNQTNNSQPNKIVQVADVSRSNSQISSGHESFDNERERRTPDDRRQRQSSQSGSESNNWRAVQTQRQVNENKDISNLRSIDDRDNDKRDIKKIDDSLKSNESKLTKANIELSESDRKILLDREESSHSQSSHSDKRSTSSREERHRSSSSRFEHLDWAAESESLMINPSQKREQPRHRHVPITQKEFESYTEPIKKNFTPLKKNNLNNIGSISDDTKDTFADKTAKDISRKSATPPLNATTESVNKNKASDLHKDENRVEHSDRDIERRTGDKDFSKDDKNLRKGHPRYESYPTRGRYPVQSFRGRGREYRRTRQSSESKSYGETKESSPTGIRNKSNNRNKSRRKSNSDESCVSEEVKKDSNKSNEDTNSVSRDSKENKPEDDKHLLNDPILTGAATTSLISSQRSDPSRRGRGAAFKTSTRGMPRVSYTPSNYGPPPSRTPFGDGIIVKSESDKNLDQNRNEKTNESRNFGSKTKDMLNSPFSKQTSNQFHDSNQNSISNSRKSNAFGGRGGGAAANFNNRSDTLPPRFQKRQNRGPQSRNDRSRPHNERSGSANQIESDVANNEEWETASESSDIGDRGDRKSKKGASTSQRTDSRSQKRKPDNRRADSTRGQQPNSGGNQASYYRNSGGRPRNNQGNVSNSRSSNSNQRNGPLSANHTENITVCAMSDVTLDNPHAVEEALIDIKNRNKSGVDLVDDELNNSETEDGFQTVSYKKRNRLNPGSDSKRIKQEVRL